MQFDAADISDILDATGEDVEVYQLGVPTGQIIRGKFRKDFEAVSPYEAAAGQLNPVLLCSSADLAGITSSNTFLIGGVEYRMNNKPQQQPSGFTRTALVKK